MPDWYTRLRELVWPAVLAAGLAVLSVGYAFIGPGSLSETLSLALAGVTLALLASRA